MLTVITSLVCILWDSLDEWTTWTILNFLTLFYTTTLPLTMASETENGLICFTNCLLPQEDGSLVRKDLWVDQRRGVILDAQVFRLPFFRYLKADELFSAHFSCASNVQPKLSIFKGTSWGTYSTLINTPSYNLFFQPWFNWHPNQWCLRLWLLCFWWRRGCISWGNATSRWKDRGDRSDCSCPYNHCTLCPHRN